MVRKKTHEQFIKEFNEKNSNANNIEILEEYKNARTKIKCRCKIDNYIWEVTPSNLLSNNVGCPMCNGNTTKTHEQFIKEIKKINSDIEILEEYKNASTKIKCRCKIDNYIWKATPNSLLNNRGCLMCFIKRQTKTHEQFIKEIKKINSDIEILEEYKNTSTKIKCRCKIDNYIWKATPNHLLSNRGCPKCVNSKGEKAIAKYLDEHNIINIQQYSFDDCKFKYVLPFDFYLPNENITIEFDGMQHYEIVEYWGGLEGFIDRIIRDTIKNEYCKNNNIRLIRIPYWEFNNIEKILDEILN